MGFLPVETVGANDDWWESFRWYWYPRLHGLLQRVGLYSISTVGNDQYVGVVREDEEAIEAELEDLSALRNPVAAYKSHVDGRPSEGSWVIVHEDAPDLVPVGMQLHFTLIKPYDGVGREIYAHLEDDWRVSPIDHVRAKNFDAEAGVKKARQFFDQSTFLVLQV